MGLWTRLTGRSGDDAWRTAMLGIDTSPPPVPEEQQAPSKPAGKPSGGSANASRVEETRDLGDEDYAPGPPQSPPTLTILHKIPADEVSTWDVPAVRCALDAHEVGNFDQSTRLANAMGRDDRISGCMTSRIRSLQGLPFEVIESTRAKSPAMAKLCAERVRRAFPQILPSHARAKIHQNTIQLGLSICQKRWTFIDGEWLPVLDPWEGQHLWWTYAQGFYAFTTEGTKRVDEDPTQWFIHQPNGYKSWMGGTVRGLGLLFMYRQFTYRDWCRYCEKHGIPILAVTMPANLDAGAKKAFFAKAQKLGAESSMFLPRNSAGEAVTLEFVEPKTLSYQAFEAFMARLDVSIAILLLGQNLTTEVTGGSYAAAKVHYDVRLDLLQGDVEPLQQDLERQVIDEYLRVNVPGYTSDACPTISWRVRAPEDDVQRAQTLFQTAQGIGLLVAGTKPVISVEEARAMLAMAKLLPKDSVISAVPPPPPPPPAPVMPGGPPHGPGLTKPPAPKPADDDTKPGAQPEKEAA